MSRITAADLIERLREKYSEEGERLSDEALAAMLPITLSTFNRWKRADPQSFPAIIWMLDQAGWLVPPATAAAGAEDGVALALEAKAVALRAEQRARARPRKAS